jgi:hypothetical protein
MPRQQSHFSMVTWSLMWLTPPRQPAMGWAYSPGWWAHLAQFIGGFQHIFSGFFGPFSYRKFGAIFFYVGHFGYIVFNNFFALGPLHFIMGCAHYVHHVG